MKHELQLKVQAWLDGELSDHEGRRTAEWIANDAEASALAAELGGIKQAMFHNETAALPSDSREFYWSKIERQIQKEADVRRNVEPWIARWRRYLAPAVGLAALACVLVMAVMLSAPPAFDEISSTTDDMEAVTFHDQSSQMTIVWLQDKTTAASTVNSAQKETENQDEPESVIDM